MLANIVAFSEKEMSLDKLKKTIEDQGWTVLGFPTIEYKILTEKQV